MLIGRRGVEQPTNTNVRPDHGLLFAVIVADGVDLVRSRPATVTGVAPAYGPFGAGRNFPAASAKLDLGTGYSAISPDFSVLFAGRYATNGGAAGVIGGTNWYAWGVPPGQATFAFSLRSVVNLATVTAPVAGHDYAVCMMFRRGVGATSRIRNLTTGVLTSETMAGTNTPASGAGVSLILGNRDDAAFNSFGSLWLTAGWNRYLTDEEAYRYVYDPFLVIRPQPRRLYVVPSVAVTAKPHHYYAQQRAA